MFSLFRKKFFTNDQQKKIVEAIRIAEQKTSGEIRLYVESNSTKVTAFQRAVTLFHSLKMERTQQRNGVLLYMAFKDKKIAVYGDTGIHTIVGQDYWNSTITRLSERFKKNEIETGIVEAIEDIGQKLQHHFPYQDNDINELPNDIVFGK